MITDFLTDSVDEGMSWIIHSGLNTHVQCDSMLGFLVLELVEDCWSEACGHPVIVLPQVWEIWYGKVSVVMLTARDRSNII